ncbi:MAG: hypothetical protein ACO3MF_04005 [Acholeplasmataceae bacterium]
MQARYKDLLKRFDFHLMFLILATYISLSSFGITLGGNLEAITMLIIIISIVILVKTYPKQRNDMVIVTPKDKVWMEYSSYTFTGLFFLQYLFTSSELSIYRGYIGILMFIVDAFTLCVIYKIIKK